LRLNSALAGITKAHGFDVPEETEVTFVRELVKQHLVGAREKLGRELTMQYEEEGRSFSLEQSVDYALDFDKD